MIPGARLVVLGRQGAGKGTQCVRLARHYVVPHISTGDMLRAAVAEGTEMGRKAREFMDSGELVPDDVMIGIVRERLLKDDTVHRGFVLDGFPRTVRQGEALIEITGPDGLDSCLNIEVAKDVVLSRLAGRRVCTSCGQIYHVVESPPTSDGVCDICGGPVVQREDDTEDAIRRRLAIYEDQTRPLISWFDELRLLIEVDGVGSPDEVTQRIVRAIDDHRRRRIATVG